MGLLDDAIREHLELRRRHGADPGEVARQEQEALGRVRRGEAPPEELDAADRDVHAGAVSLEEPPAGAPPADDDDEPVSDPPAEPAPAPSQPVGEPEAPVAPPAPAGRDDESGAVAMGELELDEPPDPRAREGTAADDAAAGEDVLEETPEFLQETPEHDRLWFEQKPPRDFEF